VGKYDKETDTGIVWNDPNLAISWGIINPIISERDSRLMSFKEFCVSIRGI
jgi:dTDP-4-dehydrorhamnose 3,5-epimerase